MQEETTNLTNGRIDYGIIVRVSVNKTNHENKTK